MEPLDIWLAREDAGIVHQIASGKVVRPINDDVVIAEKLKRVLAREARFVGFNPNVGVNVAQAISRMNSSRKLTGDEKYLDQAERGRVKFAEF